MLVKHIKQQLETYGTIGFLFAKGSIETIYAIVNALVGWYATVDTKRLWRALEAWKSRAFLKQVKSTNADTTKQHERK